MNASHLLSRRRLLQVGGAFGLSLPQLLHAEAVSKKTTTDKNCIFIILSGGISQLDTFDPKPEAPLEIRGPYGTIPTRTPGQRFTDRLPRLANCSHLFCTLRSMSHRDTVHVSAAHTMLTGQSDGKPDNDSPMMGSLVSRFKPSATMPSHVWLHNMKTGTNKVPKYLSGLSRVGSSQAPWRVGHELDNPASPDFRFDVFDLPDDISTQRMNGRFELLSRLEAGAPANDTHRVFQDRAKNLIAGDTARRAFNLGSESDRVRDRYGRHPLGQYSLMARRLIEAGVRMVSLTAWPGLAPGETTPTVTQVWDMHGEYYKDGDTMYGNGPYGLTWSLPRLDQALSALLEDLHERGMLKSTFVAVVSEFGRTPRFEHGGKGRGHWASCYSGLVAGAGVRGGTVYGSSDRLAAQVAGGRPVSQTDFGATLFHALGIPPETRYGPDELSFSYRVNEGEPLTDLFGG